MPPSLAVLALLCASAAPSQSSATSTEPAPTPIADAAPVTSELTADAEAATV